MIDRKDTLECGTERSDSKSIYFRLLRRKFVICFHKIFLLLFAIHSPDCEQTTNIVIKLDAKMPTESVDSLKSDISSDVITNVDKGKILNTDTYKPNITNEIKENERNELKSSETVPSDQRKHSLTNSLDSNNVSIETLDENVDDSSVIDSDVDGEDVLSPNEMHTAATNGIALMNDVVSSHEYDAPKLNIGSIAVQNSSGITFGNKTFYQGPVTIKQFLYDHNQWKPTDQGNDNPAFVGGSTTCLDRQPNNGMGNVSYQTNLRMYLSKGEKLESIASVSNH